MPPRPIVQPKTNRPSSAIFIGKSAQSPASQDFPHLADTPPGLPELPETPSPSSSLGSRKSGLPSPPATNSTGSGSTGDPATITIRDRPLSLHSSTSSGASTSNSGGTQPAASPSTPLTLKRSAAPLVPVSVRPQHGAGHVRTSSSSSAVWKGADTVPDADYDDDYDRENENNENDHESNLDGDDTARIDRRFLATPAKEKENDALERAKSLAARNRLALDRLGSISRLSPAPRAGTPNSSSSRLSAAQSTQQDQHHHHRTLRSVSSLAPSSPAHDQGRSGSETERESTHHSYSNNSTSSHSSSSKSSHRHSMSLSSSQTPPPPQTPSHHSPYKRLRHISGPASASSSSSPGPSPSAPIPNFSSPTRLRNRMSVASASSVQLGNFDEEDDDRDYDQDEGRSFRSGRASRAGGATAGRTSRLGRDKERERTLNERDVITQSALAAVANSRRSPVSGRRRGALPKEFRSDLGIEESSGRGVGHPTANPATTSTTTTTPPASSDGRRSVAGRFVDDGRPTPSPELDRRQSWKMDPVTPFRNSTVTAPTRSSTMRETRRSGGPHNNPRWQSEDFRSPSTMRIRDSSNYSSNVPSRLRSNDDSNINQRAPLDRERHQSLRGGSAESALWSPGGRSLLGEGLRAAGLSRRRDEDGLPAPPRSATLRVFSSTTTTSTNSPGTGHDVFKSTRRDIQTDDLTLTRDSRRALRELPPQRAATSMADYRYMEDERHVDDDVDDSRLNRHRSAYQLVSRERETSLTREYERSASVLARRNTLNSSTTSTSTANTTPTNQPPTPNLTVQHLISERERLATSSPFSVSRRLASSQPSGLPPTEHTRLLLDSLTMFETQLAKLPPSTLSSSTMTHSQGSSSSSSGMQATTHADLTRNAQAMVYNAERLCAMLKLAATKAVDAEVEAEVEDVMVDQRSQSALGSSTREKEIWRKVGAEYRDSSKVCDELVRGMTGFLLGFGRVMKDVSAAMGGPTGGVPSSEFGSPALHSRHASLSEDSLLHTSSSSQRDHHGVAPSEASLSRASGSGSNHNTVSTGSGRQGAVSRTSFDRDSRESNRQDALRRLAGEGPLAVARPDSVLARASPATFQRLSRDRDMQTPSRLGGLIDAPSSTSMRRVLTPREREFVDSPRDRRTVTDLPIASHDSQETIHANASTDDLVEPSPTPASRTRPALTAERSRTLTLTPLKIPKPLAALPSETTRGVVNGSPAPGGASGPGAPSGNGRSGNNNPSTSPATMRERRRASTIRVGAPAFPVTSNPTPTTAVTPHTVSNSVEGLVRSDSSKSGSSISLTRDGSRSNATGTSTTSSSGMSMGSNNRVTFSRPSTGSVSQSLSGHLKGRMSLDGHGDDGDRRDGSLRLSKDTLARGHPADRSALLVATGPQGQSPSRTVSALDSRRERRRTVTDIFPRE